MFVTYPIMTAIRKVKIGIRFAIADERVGELSLIPVRDNICPVLLRQKIHELQVQHQLRELTEQHCL